MSNLFLGGIIIAVVFGGIWLEWRGVWRKPVNEVIQYIKHRRRNEKTK